MEVAFMPSADPKVCAASKSCSATQKVDDLLLRVEGLSKSFGATQALEDATIDLRPGEVHILLGENGAGKSTLAKIIAGLYRQDKGEIIIDGAKVSIASAQAARQLGIAVVFQELSLIPHLPVVDNLFLGAEQRSFPFSGLRRRAEAERCRDILASMQLDLPKDTPVGTFSIAQKQMLEIGKALLRQPRILIMDEPTSTLTEQEKKALFEIVQRLKAQGVAILYVTHHLREVFEIGTRVSAMRDGRVTETVHVTVDLNEEKLLEMLTGRKLSSSIKRTPRSQADPILTVQALRTEDGCEGVDFVVHPGEVVGIYGVVGCGREALGRALVGLSGVTHGKMAFEGRLFRPRDPSHASSLGIGYLPMDRKERGILAERQIRENLSLSNLRRYARLGCISAKRERKDALSQLAQLRVRYSSMEDSIVSLSGGNQQKVLFGRAIAYRPKLLIMEDPTAGIDMGAKFDLYEMIRKLADEGFSFLLLSSDLAETLLLCDRMYTMYRGHLVDEIFEPSLEHEEHVLSSVLGRRGQEIPSGSYLGRP